MRMRIDHLQPKTASTHSATSGTSRASDVFAAPGDSFTEVTPLSTKCPLVCHGAPPNDGCGVDSKQPSQKGRHTMSLANKVVLITGAGTGIGADAARAFRDA